MEVWPRQQGRTEVDRMFRRPDGEAVHSASLYTDNTHVFIHADTYTHTHAATAPHQVTHSVSFDFFNLHFFLSVPSSLLPYSNITLSPNSPELVRAQPHSTSSSCDLIHPLPYLHSTVALSWSPFYMQVMGPLEGVRTEHCGWQQNRPHLIPSTYSTAACTGHREIK